MSTTHEYYKQHKKRKSQKDSSPRSKTSTTTLCGCPSKTNLQRSTQSKNYPLVTSINPEIESAQYTPADLYIEPSSLTLVIIYPLYFYIFT